MSDVKHLYFVSGDAVKYTIEPHYENPNLVVEKGALLGDGAPFRQLLKRPCRLNKLTVPARRCRNRTMLGDMLNDPRDVPLSG